MPRPLYPKRKNPSAELHMSPVGPRDCLDVTREIKIMVVAYREEQ
jgi:hypothetical protein